MQPLNHQRGRWTQSADTAFLAHVAAGKSAEWIANTMGRSVNAIKQHALKLGVNIYKNNVSHPWTTADDARLARIAASGGTITEAAARLKRTPSAIYTRCVKRRLKIINDYRTSEQDKAAAIVRESLWGNISLASHRLPLNQIAQALVA